VKPAFPISARCAGWVLLAGLFTSTLDGSGLQRNNGDALGPPALYVALREAKVAPAGQIRNKHLRVDRFALELTEGHLYVAPEIGGVTSTAVFLGDGVIHAYPPDAVEHHQLRKLSDNHYVKETFDRLVLKTSGNTIAQLLELGTPAPEPNRRGSERANQLLEDRRQERLERQRDNPDSWVLDDLIRQTTDDLPSNRSYLLLEVDSNDHGWLAVTVNPGQPEEVELYQYDHRQQIADSWMRFNSVEDFEPNHSDSTLKGFSTDPESLDNDATGSQLGLSVRPHEPEQEGWRPRALVPHTRLDLALDNNGDAKATAALLIDPLEPTRSLRLQISPVLEVTDVTWIADQANKPFDTALQASFQPRNPVADQSEPAGLTGEQLHYVQERHDRFFGEDLFEPWVTITLPRTIAPGESFIIGLAYEGKLVQRLRQTRDFLLRDTLFWRPQHPDARVSQIDTTFRFPDRYQIASGGTLIDERVQDGTRIMHWATTEPVRSMAFNYGRFDVTEVARDVKPALTIYANDGHIGFAPGNREKTVTDLTDSIKLFTEYFGSFPYPSLLVTETATQSGQAFPGLLFLSYQTFGELHTGEAELFRAHEVAHQWWGAAIDWKSYRDQWLSEGFANYAAALYTLYGLNRPQQFEEMMNAWRLDILGEGQVGQGLGLRHYGYRPEELRRSDGHDTGALVLGYRINSTETPFDYRILIYEKGAYILHMLRSMLLDLETGDDGRFRQLMRSYARQHTRGVMSTQSFEAAVEEAFGQPMDWFFDQWVYGVEVPTYRAELDVSPVVDSPSPFMLHGTVTQEEVSDGFKMPVPLRFTFDKHPPVTHRIWIDKSEVTVKLPLPAKPTDIEFNTQHAVLAKIR